MTNPKMYILNKLKNGFAVTLSASFEEIDTVCRDVKRFLADNALEEISFDIILGTREALSNAVRHGAKMDSSKEIVFSLEVTEEQIQIRVTDSGPGFAWPETGEVKAIHTATHGRGIEIFGHYFDSFQFNEKGNEVELFKKIQTHKRSTIMSEITKDGTTVIVKPGVDVVASMVEKLKKDLKQVHDDGATAITIDLSGTNMMDSMGIGLLIATHNSLKKNNGQLAIINASADILKLLKNMRLDQHFNIS